MLVCPQSAVGLDPAVVAFREKQLKLAQQKKAGGARNGGAGGRKGSKTWGGMTRAGVLEREGGCMCECV